VLVIKRIHVRYRLSVPSERREETERVHSFHASFCPVARSLDGAIDITTELELI
jgi:organic hydroperoxide reductase OsmC/OhrA